MKSARLEWVLKQLDEAVNILNEALEKYPKYAKVSTPFCLILIL